MPNTAAIKEDELAGLSDEERAALEEDDEETTVDDDETALSAEGDATDDVEEPEAPDVSAEDAQADDEAVADDADGADDDDPPVNETFQPEYQADPVEGYDEKIAELKSRREKLRDDWDNGEIDMREYDEQREVIEMETLELREAQVKAQISAESREQSRQQQWIWEQNRFLREASNKELYSTPIMRSALDTAIKQLAQEDETEHEMHWYLEEADRRVRELFGKAASTDAKPPSNRQSKKGARKNQPEIPPNLGDAPAADQPEVTSDEFAHLNGLDGIELEQELSKMTKAQEAKYLLG